LITGISGFAGGFLAEHLMACGDAVLGASIDGAWEQTSDSRLAGCVALIRWDLAQSDGLDEESRRQVAEFQPDCIYHLAALSIPDECGQQRPTQRAVSINVDGTRRVLELAASLPSPPRIVAISSSHVYAPVSPAAWRVDEAAPVTPARGYGQTKLSAEEEVRRAVALHGADAVIVRPFQHAGPRHNAKMMLAQWACQLAAGGAAPIQVQTCDAFIDLTDVRDVVRAYRLLAERGRRGEVYNVGSGVRRRSGDVLEMLRRMAGSSRPVVESSPGFKQDPIADTARLRDATGWQPNISLETTVADTLAWWQCRECNKHYSQ
jgi:GDP-4-dehydro-6-deoxy-D-mannose reductase